MGNQDVDNTNKEKMGGGYQFVKLPENIRQMGEPPMQNRIYIEDYVMTYMHQIFQKKRESAIVVLLGRHGTIFMRCCMSILKEQKCWAGDLA